MLLWWIKEVHLVMIASVTEIATELNEIENEIVIEKDCGNANAIEVAQAVVVSWQSEQQIVVILVLVEHLTARWQVYKAP